MVTSAVRPPFVTLFRIHVFRYGPAVVQFADLTLVDRCVGGIMDTVFESLQKIYSAIYYLCGCVLSKAQLITLFSWSSEISGNGE